MRKNRIVSAIMIGAVVLLFRTVNAAAFENWDWQLWQAEGIEAKLSDKCKVSIEEEIRFGDYISRIYYTHTDGGMTFKTGEALDLGLKYRLIYERDNDNWKNENRPYVNATVKWKLGDIGLKDRSQLELRIPEDKQDKWRYRNKFTAVFPWESRYFDIQPYVADEIFVDFHGEKLNRNRLYTGIKAKVLKHLKVELYYLWQTSKKKGKWTSFNVLGLKIKASF